MAKRKTELTAAEQEVYRKAVQKLNKQLYRLEKAYVGKEKHLSNMAYGGIQRDIRARFGVQTRYSKALPETVKEFRARMNEINRFYQKPSSTLSGIKQIYKKRADTISDQYGVKVTAEDLRRLFESGLWEKLQKQFYGSDTTMQAVASVQKNKETVISQLKQGNTIMVSDDFDGNLNRAGADRLLLEYLEGVK